MDILWYFTPTAGAPSITPPALGGETDYGSETRKTFQLRGRCGTLLHCGTNAGLLRDVCGTTAGRPREYRGIVAELLQDRCETVAKCCGTTAGLLRDYRGTAAGLPRDICGTTA